MHVGGCDDLIKKVESGAFQGMLACAGVENTFPFADIKLPRSEKEYEMHPMTLKYIE